MDYKLLMNTAVLAGVTMLKSGAETYRVEETIIRILLPAPMFVSRIPLVKVKDLFSFLQN